MHSLTGTDIKNVFTCISHPVCVRCPAEWRDVHVEVKKNTRQRTLSFAWLVVSYCYRLRCPNQADHMVIFAHWMLFVKMNIENYVDCWISTEVITGLLLVTEPSCHFWLYPRSYSSSCGQTVPPHLLWFKPCSGIKRSRGTLSVPLPCNIKY